MASSRPSPRSTGGLAPVAAALLAGMLCALPAEAQRVRLEIRPQVGDTIQMQLDQEIEMSGTAADGSAAAAPTLTASMHVRTRAIPVRRLAKGTLVLAITDSLSISPMGEWRMPESSRRALQGRRVELKVDFDGAMEVVDTGEHEGDTPPFLGPMPAMLPTGSVQVGASWTRKLAVPIGRGSSGAANVDARFRLDSLSGNGDIAYITMQGTLSRNDAGGSATGWQRSTGTLTGSLQLDRRLGWITDTRLVLSMRTLMPMVDAERTRSVSTQVQMKVTQRLRATRGS